jgi:acetyl esterase/lipase
MCSGGGVNLKKKRGFKVTLFVLLVLLIGLGGFFLYVTQVEGRSFQSKMVELVLGFGNKKYYADEEKFVQFMEMKSLENLDPYVLPEKTINKFNVGHASYDGMDCYILTGGDEPEKRQILYLHGGAYINQPVNWHWTFLNKLSKKIDVTIMVPIYPKAPYHRYDESFEKVLTVYEDLLTQTKPEDITFMGDSAGGGFALALAQMLLERGLPQPGNLILISPWLDLTLSNPEIPEFEKKDPMLARYGLAEIGKLYAGDTDPNHYMLSPINGEIKGLGQITLFIGTHDILCPEARLFRDLAAEQDVFINYFEYQMMNHCFPLFPIPEAEEAMGQMIEILTAN